MSDNLPELITNRKAGTYYNTSDLNRVGSAVAYLTAALAGCGYDTLVTHPKTNWVWVDTQQATRMAQYLGDVERIRNIFHSELSLPESMRKLTFSQANDIEAALQATDQTIREIQKTRRYSGTFYAGNYTIGGAY